MSVIRKIQYEKQFPIISIIFENGNENCHEMRNVMLEVVGNTWEVREGRGGGKGWLLITDIQNISTEHKAGKVKTPALFYASRYFSWGCCVVLRAGRVCPGMFSLWEPNISWFITSSSLPGQISLPLLLSRIFLKTPEISFRFLTANNVRELQRRAPPVSIELSKT